MSVAVVFIESRSGTFPTPWGVNLGAMVRSGGKIP